MNHQPLKRTEEWDSFVSRISLMCHGIFSLGKGSKMNGEKAKEERDHIQGRIIEEVEDLLTTRDAEWVEKLRKLPKEVIGGKWYVREEYLESLDALIAEHSPSSPYGENGQKGDTSERS